MGLRRPYIAGDHGLYHIKNKKRVGKIREEVVREVAFFAQAGKIGVKRNTENRPRKPKRHLGGLGSQSHTS